MASETGFLPASLAAPYAVRCALCGEARAGRGWPRL